MVFFISWQPPTGAGAEGADAAPQVEDPESRAGGSITFNMLNAQRSKSVHLAFTDEDSQGLAGKGVPSK